jgi:hypothetical protein
MPATIDAEHAGRVAAAFLDAPRTTRDPIVLAAYRDLAGQVNRWFVAISGPDGPRPVRVVYSAGLEPYASAAELSEAVRRRHTIEISPCARDRERRHPLLDSSVGGTFDRLRAVHDIVSHGWCRYDFDRDGEFAAWALEDHMYTGLARWAIATELHGEHSVLWTTGNLAEHKATLLDPRLLRTSRARAAGARSAARCRASSSAAAHNTIERREDLDHVRSSSRNTDGPEAPVPTRPGRWARMDRR